MLTVLEVPKNEIGEYCRVPAPVIALVFELVTDEERETVTVVPAPIEIADALPLLIPLPMIPPDPVPAVVKNAVLLDWQLQFSKLIVPVDEVETGDCQGLHSICTEPALLELAVTEVPLLVIKHQLKFIAPVADMV